MLFFRHSVREPFGIMIQGWRTCSASQHRVGPADPVGTGLGGQHEFAPAGRLGNNCKATVGPIGDPANVAAAARVQLSIAVRTRQAKVLGPVVRVNAIGVIKDQAKDLAIPDRRFLICENQHSSCRTLSGERLL